MAENANDLYREMVHAVWVNRHVRVSGDSASPAQQPMVEAEPGVRFVLTDPVANLPTFRDINLKWAAAYVLHFFAETDSAAPLRKYNRHADKYLTGDTWVGAYGTIAMCQLRKCAALLTASPYSRRAIVSMGGFCDTPDLNRPACPSFFHFLCSGSRLDMILYQRSLNLPGLMPYDCALFTNILHWMSIRTSIPLGRLIWTVGSLHAPEGSGLELSVEGPSRSLLLPCELLDSPTTCWQQLNEPTLEELL